MKRLLRSSLLLGVLGLAILALTWWVMRSTSGNAQPVPLPVPSGDQEIAWLNPATSGTAWQRFVQAVSQCPGAEVGERAFPRQTTAIPEVALTRPGRKGRLLVRWYKLTGDWKVDTWLRELTRRNPPPLAIMGGGTSESATVLARALRAATANWPESRRPLLLLTTATADRVPPATRDPSRRFAIEADLDGEPLHLLYPHRTFRFCFSNSQMAEAVTRFVWSQDDLRPDAFPPYLVVWQDDPYSTDLGAGFSVALREPMNRAAALTVAADAGLLAGPVFFPPLPAEAVHQRARDSFFPRPNYVPWSVGMFDRPNRYEAEVALELLDDLDRSPTQRRPLLVLSGQTQPSRRMVRALARVSPMRARDFVLAAGDAIAFNTICRDRDVAWSIQDLPCKLVLFCHHNPIADPRFLKGQTDVSGTEDLLLYKQIMLALSLAADDGETGPSRFPDRLRDRLRELRLNADTLSLGGEGKPLFDEEGQRRSGTGEHVVCLRPTIAGDRVLPRATVSVFAWHEEKGTWLAVGRTLELLYTGARPE